MEEGLNHPKSGLYRKHQLDVKAHAEKMMQEIGGFDDEMVENVLRNQFRIMDSDVTLEERQDIINFGEYASKRLAAGSLHSAVYRHDVGRGDIDRAMKRGAGVGSYHDILHAMFAYNRNGGVSLLPAYMQVNDRPEQFTDPAAVQEEMLVDLWEGLNGPFVRELLKSEDPVQAFIKADYYKEKLQVYQEQIEKISFLKDTHPVEYLLSAYEAYYIVTQPGQRDLENYVDDYADYIKGHRDPEGLNLFSLLHENAHSDNPDPKLLLHEFQRMLAPLLERLKNKNAQSSPAN